MAGIMDLLRMGGMPQRPQGTGMSMPPQGGMDPAMGGGGGLMELLAKAPQGMPGADMLNRPAMPDIMALIQMLLGGGSSPQGMPPLDQGAMMGELGVGTPPMAGSMTEAPPPVRPKPKKKARPEREDESRAGKMGIRTQRGKKKPSAADRMTDDMIAADRAGAGDFVRK